MRGRLVIQFKHTSSVFKHWIYVSKKRKTYLVIHFQHKLFGKHCFKIGFQTQFWNHLRPIFKQQDKGSQWQLGNYLKNGKGPPGQVCLISSSHNYPKVHLVNFFKKSNTNTKHIFFFLNIETCYLNYDTKHIFYFLNTKNTYFNNTF